MKLTRQQKLQIMMLASRRALPKFTIKNYCFDKQRDFILDAAKFKTAVCSRRAGKTEACAADLIDTCLAFPDTTSLYITLSRSNAKKIIWPILKKILKTYKVKSEINESDLSISFENGAMLYVSGAKDLSAIENFRGLALKKVYIDEAQSFRGYLKELIDDIIVPALYDYDGQLILIGTPGPICAGVFYDACHSTAWSNHQWTIVDNPHILRKSGKKPDQILKEERERRGIKESDPTYQRESLGLWVNDPNALVYRFNPTLNYYDDLPEADWHYVFGIDIGHDDADAIAVIAFSYKLSTAYVVEELVQDKQDITSLANQLKPLRDKYKPIRMVIDSGGLGKKIAKELAARHDLQVVAAEKTRKLEYIELLNDALRNENLKFRRDSIAAEDYLMIQWSKKTKEKRVISDTFHSDIADAVLYGWREAKSYIKEEAPPKTLPQVKAREEIDLWEIREDERLKQQTQKNWWEDY